MLINQQPNIIQSERFSHKRKSIVTKEKLSKNNYQRTPLMRESDDVSFKGVSFKGSYADKVKKSFAFFNKHQYNLEENLKLLKKYIGKAPVELESNTREWKAISKHIIKSQQE